jgi:hypothetical protein
MTDPAAVYRRNAEAAVAAQAEEERRFSRVATVRAVVFVAAVGLAIATVVERGGAPLAILGIVALLFVGLVVWHERVARARDRARASVAYYGRGLARLEARWLDGGDPGDRYRDDQHLYSADLELFGRGSLFHLISTARTETGAATLAGWLSAPAPVETVLARQEAVRELAPNLDLRHDLAVVGQQTSAALDSAALRNWATAPPRRWLRGAPVTAAVLSVVNVILVGAALADRVPGLYPAIALTLSLVLALAVRPGIREVLSAADRPARELGLLAVLLDRLRTEQFTSGLLARLMAASSGSADAAPALVRRLERLIDLVDTRRNQLFIPISGVLLAGTQLGFAIERWRNRHGRAVVEWIAAIGEFEALGSLATHAFEHPDDRFPEIKPSGAPIEAVTLAHPLLPEARAVRNDLALGGECRLLVVSGSNMSGKSTLLKALGTNLVLAFAGGPVRAERLATGPLALGASLVLRDSLLEGRSRFFTEVLRLKAIAQLAESGSPVLFLLDELLSGTNSHDRAIGARGVLEGLVARGAIGIVTTHDLALTEIALALGRRAQNWHLDDELVAGELVFDYRLKPGVVTRSNALELMRMVGLGVPGESVTSRTGAPARPPGST